MTEVLSYKQFGAQAGDLGSLLQAMSRYPDSLLATNILGTNPVPPEQNGLS